MPRDPNEVGTPHDWLRRAKSNLIRAKQPKPEEVLWEDLCFDTQQAAEKALKAVLLARGIPFRFVHDIAELLTLLENQGVILSEEIKASAELTDYSVESRYPGPFEPVTEEEFNRALKIAETVVVWADSQIGK
ncbi:MAG: HEPN domain-containing protein [Desulfobacterales bacterium]|jgi:HEPN domain-containing protein|nr:HEPN domain-containing protein [Desulfobacterales bacterium]